MSRAGVQTERVVGEQPNGVCAECSCTPGGLTAVPGNEHYIPGLDISDAVPGVGYQWYENGHDPALTNLVMEEAEGRIAGPHLTEEEQIKANQAKARGYGCGPAKWGPQGWGL